MRPGPGHIRISDLPPPKKKIHVHSPLSSHFQSFASFFHCRGALKTSSFLTENKPRPAKRQTTAGDSVSPIKLYIHHWPLPPPTPPFPVIFTPPALQPRWGLCLHLSARWPPGPSPSPTRPPLSAAASFPFSSPSRTGRGAKGSSSWWSSPDSRSINHRWISQYV